MGGEEVARRLALMKSEVKLIASSGYADSPVMSECRRYGFSSVLKKPYKVEEMAEVLQVVLQK
jgi:CheY-like chemotaxis protein